MPTSSPRSNFTDRRFDRVTLWQVEETELEVAGSTRRVTSASGRRGAKDPASPPLFLHLLVRLPLFDLASRKFASSCHILLLLFPHLPSSPMEKQWPTPCGHGKRGCGGWWPFRAPPPHCCSFASGRRLPELASRAWPSLRRSASTAGRRLLERGTGQTISWMMDSATYFFARWIASNENNGRDKDVK